jgi:hypothetical protein
VEGTLRIDLSGKLERGAELLEEIGVLGKLMIPAICGLPIPPPPAAAGAASAQ